MVDMEDAKFTPGPWSEAHLKEKGCRCGYVFSEGGETIAKVLYNDREDANYCRYEEDLSLETARANAALIAAAPDMYAALEACERYLVEKGCSHEYPVLQNILASLRKANGQE
jgi:hypothetical protein